MRAMRTPDTNTMAKSLERLGCQRLAHIALGSEFAGELSRLAQHRKLP
jgi:hypothetical protein